jgi:type I restriction enzyme, S subunit
MLPMVPLKRVASVNDDSLPEDCDPLFSFRYVDISAVGDGRLVSEPETLAFSDAPSRARRLVHSGDTLVSTVRTYLRAVCPVDEELSDAVVSTGFAVVRARHIDPRYLSWVLRSSAFIEEVVNRSTGVSYPAINPTDLMSIQIPRPKLDEQLAIADFLDAETARLDSLEHLARRRYALAKERFRASQATMVLRGLNPVTGDGCETAWPVSKLGIVVALQRGHDLPHESRRYGDVPVVSSGGVSGWHDFAICQPPGVVTGRYGTIGEVFLVDRPYWPLNTTLYVSEFRGCVPSWVRHLLSCLPLDAESEKSAVGGIDRKVIGDLRVPAPLSEEQEVIARELDHLRSVTDQVSKNLLEQAQLLQERRQALITAAVAGQLDLARGIAEEAS